MSLVQMDRICRMCLSEDTERRSIFTKDEATGEEVKLLEMLMTCATIEVVEGDGLPSQVCLQCVHHITKSYAFNQLCERSDNTLRQLTLTCEEPYLEQLELQKVDTDIEDAVQILVKLESLSEHVEVTFL